MGAAKTSFCLYCFLNSDPFHTQALFLSAIALLTSASISSPLLFLTELEVKKSLSERKFTGFSALMSRGQSFSNHLSGFSQLIKFWLLPRCGLASSLGRWFLIVLR